MGQVNASPESLGTGLVGVSERVVSWAGMGLPPALVLGG